MIERITHAVKAINALNVFSSCYTVISAVKAINALNVFSSCYTVISAALPRQRFVNKPL